MEIDKYRLKFTKIVKKMDKSIRVKIEICKASNKISEKIKNYV